MAGGNPLRVRLLGGLDVEGVEPRALGSRKQRTFVKVLALGRGAPVPVDAIADALWPEEQPAKPADQVAVLASRTRQALGADRVTRTDAGYALHADWVDVVAVEELADESARRLAAGRYAAARELATAGLAHARGSLLPEEPDAPWCAAARTATARTAGRLRLLAAEAALAAGDAAVAADLAEAALDADPYDEAALRLVMTACAAGGRPARGLARYALTRRLLDDELGVRPAPETEAVHLDLLAERVPDAYPVGRALAGSRERPSLPGRAVPLAALDAALARVRARGSAELVAVSGEAGIGKTRLLTTWTATVDATVLYARCDELGRTLPLQPLLDALAGAVPADDPDAAIVGPLFRREPATGERPIGDASDRGPVFAALLRTVARVAGSGPLVLVLDDAHLADESTLAWLAYARRGGLPLLLLAAYRVEEPTALDPTTTVALGPLDREAAVEAVGAERAAQVYERSGGHPLFLVELAGAEGDALPASLRDAVAGRVARAGDAAATVRAAAVLGPEVDLDLLASVVDLSPAIALDHLETGVRLRLLDERGARFAFRHALVREALASSVGGSRRALLHREAARVLGTRTRIDPLDLAYHARLAGDVATAARSLADAAAIAGARFDHAAALALLDDAIALADAPALRRARGRVLIMLTRYADAAADATVALAADPRADSLELASQAAYYAHDFGRAAALGVEAGRHVEAGDAQRARCLAFAGRALHAKGDLPGADDLMRAAAGVPGGATRPEVLVWTGSLRVHQGRAAEAVDLLSQGYATGDPLPFAPVAAAMYRGLALATLGRPLEALAEFDRTDAEAAARQLTRYAGRSDNCRGYVLRNLGAVGEADEWNARGVEGGASVGHPEPQAYGLLDLADGRLLAGDLDAAAALLERAKPLQAIPHSGLGGHVLRRELLRGRLAYATGDLPGAEARASAALDLATAHGRDRYVVLARLLLTQVLLRRKASVDLTAVERDLDALDRLAGLDGWRVTQDLAAAGGVAAWWDLAHRRVERLADAAGPRGDVLRGYAARRAESTTTGSRTG